MSIAGLHHKAAKIGGDFFHFKLTVMLHLKKYNETRI